MDIEINAKDHYSQLIDINQTGFLVKRKIHGNTSWEQTCLFKFQTLQIHRNNNMLYINDSEVGPFDNPKDFIKIIDSFIEYKSFELLHKLIMSNPVDSIESLQEKSLQICKMQYNGLYDYSYNSVNFR